MVGARYHQFLKDIYKKSDINSAFNGKIEIFKLKPNSSFFKELESNSPKIRINRGFCRSLYLVKNDADINENQKKVVDHILSNCDEKFQGKFGVRYKF
jgi:hypothetical protein